LNRGTAYGGGGISGKIRRGPEYSIEVARRQMSEIAGLRLHDNDTPKLAEWLDERLQALALSSFDAYAQLLASDVPRGRQERERVAVHFSTGETYFFRDEGLCSLLARKVLPELIERRAEQRSLRLWSAGCASGEEAYSLAMLLDEMSPRLAGWDVRVLGTDINGDAVERARNGLYGQWSFRGLDRLRMERYFRKCARGWKIDERLQQTVDFARLDLLHDDFASASGQFENIDLILCRNVFIYLSPSAVSTIVAKFTRALARCGYLISGHSELIGCETPSLRPLAFPESVLYRKVEAHAAPGAAVEPAANAEKQAAATRGPAVRSRSRAVAVPANGPPPRDVWPLRASPADPALELEQAWRDADRGALAAARAACRRVIAGAPLDPRPYYLLAQLAQEAGAIEDAKRLLKKVLYLDARFVVAYLDLAALLAFGGDAAGARRMRENARRELERIDPQTLLPSRPETTAADLLQFVGRLLDVTIETAAPSCASSPGNRPARG